MLQAIFPAKVLHIQYINKEFNKSHTDRHTPICSFRFSDLFFYICLSPWSYSHLAVIKDRLVINTQMFIDITSLQISSASWSSHSPYVFKHRGRLEFLSCQICAWVRGALFSLFEQPEISSLKSLWQFQLLSCIPQGVLIPTCEIVIASQEERADSG